MRKIKHLKMTKDAKQCTKNYKYPYPKNKALLKDQSMYWQDIQYFLSKVIYV